MHTPALHPPARVRGWYEWELVGRSGIVERTGTAHNLILNTGLNALMTHGYSTFATYIAVGTGSTAPNAGQTGLVAEIARTSQTLSMTTGTGVLSNLGNGLYRRRFGVAFDYTQANGNLTEFGASASASAGANLNSRALLTDAGGTPITITKTSDKRLIVYYNVEIQLSPITETAGTVNIAGIGDVGVTYMWTTRPQTGFDYGDIGIYDSAAFLYQIGTYTSAAPQMTYATTSDTPGAVYGGIDTYTAGTYTRTVTGERPAEGSDVTVYGYNLFRYNTSLTNAFSATLAKVKLNSPIVKNKDYKLKFVMRYGIAAA